MGEEGKQEKKRKGGVEEGDNDSEDSEDGEDMGIVYQGTRDVRTCGVGWMWYWRIVVVCWGEVGWITISIRIEV